MKTVDELIAAGHIERSTSPWKAPLLVVWKKDGTHRVVVDYRGLNAVTIDQAYTMKDQYELLEILAGNLYYSAIDLLKGYYHILITEECRELTAFAVPGPQGGCYQWKVMPFRLKGAPMTFQQFINDVFREVFGVCAVGYIDDLRVASMSKEQHIQDLKKVLQLM